MNETTRTSFRSVDLDEFRELMDGGEYDLVDVREGWEHERGHIPGCRNVVLNDILANPAAQHFADRTIFICNIGERSAVASEMALALGVKEVINFRGGHKAWREAGLPLDLGR
jgi:rhodanese-related sulfurtransferase